MRGSILDLVPFMVILGIFGLVLVIASGLNTSFSAGDHPLIQGEAEVSVTNSLQVMDANSIFLAIGIIIAVVMAALAIQTNPVFIIPALIVIFIIISVSPMISNGFMSVMSSPSFVTEANKYPTTIYIIDSLPLIAGVASVMILMALYSKGGERT